VVSVAGRTRRGSGWPPRSGGGPGRHAAGPPVDPVRRGRGRCDGIPPGWLAAVLLEPAGSRREARPGTPGSEKEIHALWLLPPEARGAPPGRPEGGVEGLAVARRAPVVAFGAGCTSARPRSRRTRSVRRPPGGGRDRAALRGRLPGSPLDHWLAPAGISRRRAARRTRGAPRRYPDWSRRVHPVIRRDRCRSHARRPDRGRRAQRHGSIPEIREDLVAYDVATGEARVLTPATPGTTRCLLPGRAQRGGHPGDRGSPDTAQRAWLVLVDLATGSQRTLAADLDRWPNEPAGARRQGDLLHGR